MSVTVDGPTLWPEDVVNDVKTQPSQVGGVSLACMSVWLPRVAHGPNSGDAWLLRIADSDRLGIPWGFG